MGSVAGGTCGLPARRDDRGSRSSRAAPTAFAHREASAQREGADLLIAVAAEANGLTLVHYDADCDWISAITWLQCEWVVAAGRRRLPR
jgi:hypothetical protein